MKSFFGATPSIPARFSHLALGSAPLEMPDDEYERLTAPELLTLHDGSTVSASLSFVGSLDGARITGARARLPDASPAAILTTLTQLWGAPVQATHAAAPEPQSEYDWSIPPSWSWLNADNSLRVTLTASAEDGPAVHAERITTLEDLLRRVRAAAASGALALGKPCDLAAIFPEGQPDGEDQLRLPALEFGGTESLVRVGLDEGNLQMFALEGSFEHAFSTRAAIRARLVERFGPPADAYEDDAEDLILASNWGLRLSNDPLYAVFTLTLFDRS